MDVSASLEDELVAVISNAELSLKANYDLFQKTRKRILQSDPAVEDEGEALFIDSLKLKNKLDELESQAQRGNRLGKIRESSRLIITML
jgi:hypothetical protein